MPSDQTAADVHAERARADRNYRIAMSFAAALHRAGLAFGIAREMRVDLSLSGGHCGEGTFERGQRRQYEGDLTKAITMLEKAAA